MIREHICLTLLFVLQLGLTMAQVKKVKPLDTAILQLSPITITAEKRESMLQSTPLSVTAYGAKKLNNLKVWNLSDMGSLAPNVHVQMGGSDNPAFSVRGIVPPAGASFDQPVAVYLDGVLQYDAANTLNQLYDVERVEVLRGPQGTLYGRNAMSGVINLVTRKPVAGSGFSGFAEASAGSQGMQRYVAGLQFPIFNNILTGSVSAFHNRSNGYFTNVYNNSDFDRNRHFGYNAKIRLLPNEAWDVILNVKQQLSDNHGVFPYIKYEGNTIAYKHVTYQDTSGRERRKFFNASLSLRHKAGQFETAFISAYQTSSRLVKDGSWDFDWTIADINSMRYSDHPGENGSRTFSQEIRVNNPTNTDSKWNWTLGAFYFYHERREVALVDAGADAALAGDAYAPYQLNTPLAYYNSGIAFFGQVIYSFNEKLKVTAGLRRDSEFKIMHTRTDMIKAGFPNLSLVEDTRKDGRYRAISPKINVSYQLLPSVLTYANYARGFRAGGLNNRTIVPAFFSYNPEFTSNWEIGLKSTFFSNRLTANFSVFYLDWRDMQIAVFLPGSTLDVALRNAGRAESKGLELELSAIPVKGLELQYSFGLTAGRYLKLDVPDPQTGLTVDRTGNRLIGQPGTTSTLVMNYTKAFSAKSRGMLQLEWSHLGTQYFDVANTIIQKSYSLFNVRAGLSYNRYDLAVWMRNIADKQYVSSIFSSGSPFVMLGSPTSYGLTLATKF